MAAVLRGVGAYRLDGVVRAVVLGVVCVRGFGVVWAYVLGVVGVAVPRVAGILYSGNGSVWSGAGRACRCLFFGLVGSSD